MLCTMGYWFEGSGWLNILSNTKVTTPGNQSLLTRHEVAKSIYAQQVTANVLYRLMRNTYEKTANLEEGAPEGQNEVSFDSWRAEMEVRSAQFQYWSIGLKMEMALFLFVRSIRPRNFVLYKYVIDQLLPWTFALDHIHYACWLSIHLWVSLVGIDHHHEQLNADMKGCASGAVGLMEEEERFLRLMICGPEEFEA